jgi:6-phosphogluconolactonase
MVDFFVGAYTDDMGGEAVGIGALGRLDDGSLDYLGVAVASDSPSYLAAHGHVVYAVEEAAGALVAFRRGNGIALERIDSAYSGGTAPCHVARYGDTIVTACYVDGRLGVHDAEPLALAQVLEGSGDGPHPAQDGPHAHATFALDDSTIVSADLGADLVHVHSLRDGVLTRTASVELPAGTGPRDFVRHASGLLFVLGELGLTLVVLEWSDGKLAVVGSHALPGAEPGDHASGLTASADGRFVWAGLRGSNRIAVLAVSDDGRSVIPVTSVSAEGDWPRHHVIDGDVMHVAHERSSTVASFRIGDDGVPRLIAAPIAVPSPIFLLAV